MYPYIFHISLGFFLEKVADMVCRYEMMGEPQRDITPEQAAARLRACGGELYRKKMNH